MNRFVFLVVMLLQIISPEIARAEEERPGANNPMIELHFPLHVKLPLPLTIRDQKVHVNLSGEGERQEIVFAYPQIGVTPPVTSTQASLLYLKNVRSVDEIYEHYGATIEKKKFEPDSFHRQTQFEAPAGTVLVLERLAVPTGSTHAYVLSRDGKHGAVYFGPITNLKFDWSHLAIDWP
jgi:hypothetical protein